MTLQQLEYIVAVDKHRHFVRAAADCGVTQSTLSSMIQKLEQELDIQIFDRNTQPVQPTAIGTQIISQAKGLLFNAAQLQEFVSLERNSDVGHVRLGVIPTIAPYILPFFIKYIHDNYASITIKVVEASTANLVRSLELAEIDIALLATPLGNVNLIEVPIYYEKFVAYISPSDPLYKNKQLDTSQLASGNIWVLHEGHCWRDQVLNLCEHRSTYAAEYEAGSISTLTSIVDNNGGYTLIPELHVDMLTQSQKQHIRRITSPEPVREISLVVRRDYVRERVLNIISECVQHCIPEAMIDPRLKKFRIRL